MYKHLGDFLKAARWSRLLRCYLRDPGDGSVRLSVAPGLLRAHRRGELQDLRQEPILPVEFLEAPSLAVARYRYIIILIIWDTYLYPIYFHIYIYIDRYRYKYDRYKMIKD